MNSVGIDAIHEFLLGGHEPDGEAPFCRDPGIDTGVLNVLWLALFVFEDETDFRIGFHPGVDLAGANLELVMRPFRKKRKAEEEKKKSANGHGSKTWSRC